MNLFYTIKQTLEHTNHDELLKTLGYSNLQKGHLTLKQFLDTGDIYLWLKKGEYDLKYNSEQFLQQLLKALNLSSASKDELTQYNNRLNAIRAMRNSPYVFIDTRFKRKGEPIHVLSMVEGRRNIRIDKELLVFKSESEVLALIGDVIREHYTSHHGKLNLWGKIYTYIYHDTDGRKYIFDTSGTLLQGHTVILESRAELKIGNQKINFMIKES